MHIGSFYYEIPAVFPPLTVTGVYYVLFALVVFCLARPFRSFLRPYVLFLANIFFVWSFSRDLYFLAVLLVCTLLCYILGFVIDQLKDNFVIYLIALGFAAVLGAFKYTSLTMPLGLSFYLFKIISYLFDVQRGKIPVEKNPLYLADHIMFFPCLTAGPINRAPEFLKELKKPSEFDYKDAKSGGFLLSLGIFEKLVFTDYLVSVATSVMGNAEVTGLNLAFGIFVYAFVVYLDFDSISNIAIGTARLLGFHLPKNFNSPYLADNLQDFWRRWHISLSSWFRDYLYIPLGGNRKGEARKYLNLIIVFLVSGIWHGNTVNFLLWGLLHGLIQVAEALVLKPFKKIRLPKAVKLLCSLVGVVINFIIVSLLWLLFKYSSMAEIAGILTRLVSFTSFDVTTLGFTRNEIIWLAVVLATTVILDVMRSSFDCLGLFNRLYFPLRWAVYALLIVLFLVFGVYGGSFDATDFMYQWF